jgi:hypothetical protein
VEPWVVIVIVIAVGVLFYLAQRFGLIDLSNKSRTSGSGGVMGIGDEVFNPTRHEAQLELDRQTVLPAPAPLPGDDDRGIYNGQVKIDLTTERAPGKHSAAE